MPLITQKKYVREDARRNPDVLYVFGDNVLRKGMGGQAFEMRNEPNAVGVATKNIPSNDPDAFFGEEAAQIVAQNRIIDEDMKPLFKHLKEGGVVIWPADGIGTGLSRMPDFAPSSFAHLESKLAALSQVADLFKSGRLNAAKKKAAEHE